MAFSPHRVSYADDLGVEIIDVFVGPERKHYVVHKNLLTTQSEYFRKALTGNFMEAREKSIHLKEEDPAAASLFIAWLYRGVIPGTEISRDLFVKNILPFQESVQIPVSEKGTQWPFAQIRVTQPLSLASAAETSIFQHICSQPEYTFFSTEELRLADYNIGRRYQGDAPSVAPGETTIHASNSLFGTPFSAHTSNYPNSTAAPLASSTLFGTLNLANSASQPSNATSLFGNSWNANPASPPSNPIGTVSGLSQSTSTGMSSQASAAHAIATSLPTTHPGSSISNFCGGATNVSEQADNTLTGINTSSTDVPVAQSSTINSSPWATAATQTSFAAWPNGGTSSPGGVGGESGGATGNLSRDSDASSVSSTSSNSETQSISPNPSSSTAALPSGSLFSQVMNATTQGSTTGLFNITQPRTSLFAAPIGTRSGTNQLVNTTHSYSSLFSPATTASTQSPTTGPFNTTQPRTGLFAPLTSTQSSINAPVNTSVSTSSLFAAPSGVQPSTNPSVNTAPPTTSLFGSLRSTASAQTPGAGLFGGRFTPDTIGGGLFGGLRNGVQYPSPPPARPSLASNQTPSLGMFPTLSPSSLPPGTQIITIRPQKPKKPSEFGYYHAIKHSKSPRVFIKGIPISEPQDHELTDLASHQAALLNLCIMAETQCWPALFNDAINAFVRGEHRLQQPLSVDCIDCIYKRTYPESPLRAYVMDSMSRMRAEGVEDISPYMKMANKHEDFLADLLGKVMDSDAPLEELTEKNVEDYYMLGTEY